MNILKRTLAGLLVVFLAFGQVTVIPGDWVQGFSNLITTGSNVYVTGVGTIGQDTSFTRSAAGRYTLYDATVSTGVTTLTVRAGAGQSSTNLANFIASNGATYAGLANNGTLFSTDYVSALSSPVFVLAAGTWNTRGLAITSDFPILWSNSTSNSGATKDLGLARSSAGVLAVTDGSTGQGSITAKGATVYDATASTGVTTLTVRAGEAQSTTDLLAFALNDGNIRGRIYTSDGGYNAQFYNFFTMNSTAALQDTGGLLSLQDVGGVKWSSTSVYSGTKDLGIIRGSAGTAAFTNGLTGGSLVTYATIGADGIILNNGRFQIPTSTPASASAACTTGTIAWDTNFTYVCVATDTWKRAAMLTW